MSEETTPKWQDELFDEIEEMLADTKQVKFNTHKNRKVFFGKIKSLVLDAMRANTILKDQPYSRPSMPTITRPNPNKSQGFAVMTEGMSAKGDEIVTNKPPGQKRAGMRSW